MTPDCPNPDANREPAAPSSHWTSYCEDERFRLLVENSRDIIVEISDAGEVLYVTPNVALVLGYSAAELIGADLFALVHPDDIAEVRENFVRRTGRATGRARHKDGTWRWFETSSSEFLVDGAARRVLVARDITAEREAAEQRALLEAELARAEKLNALGTLAGGMAHDFNNMLTAILVHASLARARARESDVRESLTQIIRAGERAKSIAQQFLDFSGQRGCVHAPVDLAAVAREVLQLLHHVIPPQIEVVADLSPDCRPVLGNATQLHQVLVNLCHNAVHAMRDRRGRLIVRVASVEVNDDSVHAHATVRRGAYIRLSVIDDGHGMDAATQRRIFEPFFTTKARGVGTGLGLAVVQLIVREHGGIIDIASRPEEGTVFHIYFPARGERAASAPRAAG